MKKFLSILLALLLVLPLSVAATEIPEETTEPEAAPNQCGADVFWSYEEGVLTFTGSGPMNDFYENVPWEDYRYELTTVILAGDITAIGAYAFMDFDALTTIDFGPALTEIGYQAFMYCDGLTAISLPATFKLFFEDSLRGCPNLKEIHLAGGCPSFRQNCLWDTYVDIYFPAEQPWSVDIIAPLEEAFHGRVEFLASDGTDPYVPTEPTEEATEPETTEEVTEPETTEAPTEPETEPETTEEATEPETTGEVTEPEATEEVTTQIESAPTQPESTEAETPAEVTEPERESKAWIGVMIVVIILLILNLGVLVMRRSKGGKSGKR